MGGFECSTQINAQHKRLDMIASVGHDKFAEADYRRLCELGLRTARDGTRWHLIDRGGTYDWSSFEPMFNAAQRTGIQVIWDLFHYGFADGVDPFAPSFIDRFSKFAGAVAQFVRDRTDEIPFYTPMNEISFFTWAACRDVMWPYAHGRDEEFKRQLVRASIAAVDAIWKVDRRARICWAEPLINVFPPRDKPELARQAAAEHESQFEAWDWVRNAGQEYLDIIGLNFYYGNQWEVSTRLFLDWEPEKRDERWVPVNQLLAGVYRRYKRPLFIAETGHFGIGRAPWITDFTGEVKLARENGVPVEGICLYPILDRFDWHDENHWHNSGLWDLRRNGSGDYERVLNSEYVAALKTVQSRLVSR
jgi:beta-glucosidase/6-phospho-beta-glucosidase/beta-galactosidase